MARTKRKLKVVDLFCGAGGLAEGFRQAGYAVLGGVDIDPDACATFAQNFLEAETIHGDLRKRKIFEHVLTIARDADIVVGGPPCQAFSQVRNHDRLIKDPRNSLYREFVRVLDVVRPRAFVMENVPGMAQLGVEDQVAEDLSLSGAYRVRPQLLDACDFGVPQTRKRFVFVGVAADLAVEPPQIRGTGAAEAVSLVRRTNRERPRYEVTNGIPPAHLHKWLTDPANRRVVSVEQAISDLAGLRVGARDDELAVGTLPAPSSAYQKAMRRGLNGVIRNVSVPRINRDTAIRLGAIPAGGNHRDLPEELLERYLTGQKWGPHNGSGRLGRRHYYAYRRLHPEIWAWTLNTKADSVYHWTERRALSVREFARLQSFPDTFVFTTDSRRYVLDGRIDGGAAHSRYRQAGNAVPPLLARAVARAVSRVIR